jgi:hypothetical protein
MKILCTRLFQALMFDSGRCSTHSILYVQRRWNLFWCTGQDPANTCGTAWVIHPFFLALFVLLMPVISLFNLRSYA